MSLLSTLVSYFKSRSAVVALLGTGCDRLYAGSVAPESERRLRCEMRRNKTSHGHTLVGLDGIARSVVTIECISDESPGAADELADAMAYSGIVNFRGNAHGVNIRSVQLSDGPEQYLEGVDPGSERYRYVTAFQLLISYQVPC